MQMSASSDTFLDEPEVAFFTRRQSRMPPGGFTHRLEPRMPNFVRHILAERSHLLQHFVDGYGEGLGILAGLAAPERQPEGLVDDPVSHVFGLSDRVDKRELDLLKHVAMVARHALPIELVLALMLAGVDNVIILEQPFG